MNILLQHLVAITENRDHRLLDLSVLSALCEITGASGAKLLDLFAEEGEPMIRPRATLENGVPVVHCASDMPREPLQQYPALCEALANKQQIAHQPLAQGHVCWILVWQADKVSTCMEVHTRRALRPEETATLQGILAVYRNFQNLLDYSERDSLTGLLNRKTFDERFARLMQDSLMAPAGETEPERRHPPAGACCLAVIDIDHFKRINDRFGHLYGDEVLILVANLLRTRFRAEDAVFRFGGEEFVVLLGGAGPGHASQVLERFRDSVENHDFPQVGQVTVSIGYSSIEGLSPVQVLGQADSALYHAKQSGRNRICEYESLVQQGLIAAPVLPHSNETFFD